MKCPMCSGKGMVDYPMYADDEHKWQYCVARMKKCDMCNGTGEVSMTNEEWLKQANTEQLAEWLSEKLDYCQIMWYWACDKCTWSKKNESCMNDKEKWVEWLKQPYKEN